VHEVLAALNRVSIDTKLSLADHPPTRTGSEQQNARAVVSRFLRRFDELLQSLQGSGAAFVAGVDPRLESLAERYLHETRQRPRRSALAGTTPGEIDILLRSAQRKDQERLIACLRDLRRLIEQHTYADLGRLLGEI